MVKLPTPRARAFLLNKPIRCADGLGMDKLDEVISATQKALDEALDTVSASHSDAYLVTRLDGYLSGLRAAKILLGTSHPMVCFDQSTSGTET